ncbi:enoyl-CoA hydratase/isomerase family protein [Desulfofundulus thermosubterraneus]|uniref:short-chain-enoyl-CoA hydratase n=1 Tax=Desulfofundulus thermosubterraneus DSM 16057 TaxID=1121432 RepID=A0A1M6IMR8_9FIRM|nr:enoyl-CoA hydratase-related protein [Desulfofundulus thermosubterraneus]SHJ35754.1 enoyl-CoA hydratase [Desulfofundulus thermosubterraneus DSM 16057]
MGFKNLILEKEEGIAVATVNRPEVRNALNRETWQEINSLIDQVEKDEEIQVLIFTGAGDKAFVAGADVASLKERTMLETFVNENQATLNRLANMEKVTIAAINGYALGGGCELALACDLRVAAENARLGQPELNLGILPGAGGTQRLARLVGIGNAKELILTGEIIDAAEAYRIGLVNKVVPAGEAVRAAKEMAQKIMAKGPLAVRFAKAVINWGSNVSLESGLIMERLAQTILFGTEDRLEGLTAFLEKRRPVYKGR